jgi:hypothetical protein
MNLHTSCYPTVTVLNKTGCMLQWTNNTLCSNNWSTVIEQIFIHFKTEDMLKVCYSFHLQPPTYISPVSHLSPLTPQHSIRHGLLLVYRTTELWQYWTNALQKIRGNWTTVGWHYSATSGNTWQGVSAYSLSMGQTDRVVDQHKLEGSFNDKKMIPLKCVPQISMAWKSHGLDKQQYPSDHWLCDLWNTKYNTFVTVNNALLGQTDWYYKTPGHKRWHTFFQCVLLLSTKWLFNL